MIISEKHAMRLIREGKAIIEGTMFDADMITYAILSRTDKQRTDHFRIDENRYQKLKAKWQGGDHE